MKALSILILDATGRLGTQFIRASTMFEPRPEVHAYSPDPSRLSEDHLRLCQSVHKGELTSASDISLALRASAASVVILPIDPDPKAARPIPCSDSPKSGVSSADTRRLDAARALMDAIGTLGSASAASVPSNPSEAAGEHAPEPASHSVRLPRIVVISALGAGGTTLRFTLCMGKLMTTVRRAELEDHDAAEREVRTRLGVEARRRLLIVRPTRLVDARGTGKVRVFQRGRVAAPLIPRQDVAEWVMEQACLGRSAFGREVNICKNRGRRESQWAVPMKPFGIEFED